jgi:hypothetical protein
MEITTIQAILANIDELEDDLVIYATKMNGQFSTHSEFVVMKLLGDTIINYGNFEYFLEIFLMKNILKNSSTDFIEIASIIDRIIHYAEYDC